MSFTVNVKEELIALSTHDKAELSAMIKLSGNLGIGHQGLTLSLSTENAKVARHVYELVLTNYAVKADIRYHQKTNLKKNRVYQVFLERDVEVILNDLHLADSFFGLETGINPEILSQEEASRAYLRGAFLASGTVKDPEKGKYQLEIASIYSDHAQDLAQLMQGFLLDAKVIERKKGTITYLQRAEDIMDFFIVIGAMGARDGFEEVKMLRETRNDLNRANNVEMANIARTVSASVRTINNLVKLDGVIGLDNLPADLQEVAVLRLAHPDYSIQQLADSLTTPITKSGVNHRLRKLNKMADDL
ncbi:DNA-binding protein WhiA [Streptococcus merionis]|uniref:Probable cell division protein WhiA n=1 Tax=Streptococcus merionis TaxID=400065 RepID=A0A239SQZ1_9STRE|nr:DNA-binding protein WhiA [Streptococcus merionis]SNU87830.1 Putative sporulation transcription regulator WhiA [Streptococcus merionis]